MACTRERVLISPVGVGAAAQPVVSLAPPRDNLAVFSGEDGGRFPRLLDVLRLDALRETSVLAGAGGLGHEVETGEILEAVDVAALVAKAVLDGGDLSLLAQSLSSRLQNTVVVSDRDYQVLAFSSAGEGTGNRAGRRNIRTRTLELFLRGLENSAEPLAEGASSFVLPLPVGGEIAGYLAVLEKGRKVSPAERSALEQSGFLVAMAILKCCFAEHYERRRQSDLIFELVEGSGEMEPALDERVRKANPFLEKPGHILWVELVSPAVGKDLVRGEAEPGPVKLKDKALALLAGHLTSRHEELVVARQTDKLLLFLPVEGGKADEKRLGAVAANLREELAALMPAREVALGVSRPCCGYRDWPSAYREAREAARIGAELGGGGKVYRFGDMGGYQLLARLRGSSELTGFYQSVLGKLDRLEAPARNEMIKTLEMHFAANGSINRMAELMYMHRNSLKYRLDKIEELLGVDLDDPEIRFNLQLALRIRHFLR